MFDYTNESGYMSQLLPALLPAVTQERRWEEFEARFGPTVTYQNIAAQTTGHIVHPQLSARTLFTYNGQVPGPLFKNFYGQRVLVQYRNNLPLVGFDGFGRGEISTHLHNGHTASESDGFPADFFPAPKFKDHHRAKWPCGSASGTN